MALLPALAVALIAVDGVYVNGSGPFRFLIDTGSQSTVVAPRLARQLGLSPSYRVEVVTVNGRLWAAAGKVTSVSVGRHSAAQCEVLWVEPGVAGIDGILGQSFLKHFSYAIDYRARKVHIGVAPPRTGIRVELSSQFGRPVIRAGRLLLETDSGASALVLFRAPPGWRATGTVEARTSAGTSMMPYGRLDRLRIGGVVLRDIETAISSPALAGIDGLLPLSLFDSVYVDSKEGYAVFEPKPVM